MKKYQDILERCPLFSGIKPDDLGAMLGCIGGRTQSYAKGEVIWREGDAATHVGMVLHGAVRLEREDYYGNRSIVARRGAAELFCESYCLYRFSCYFPTHFYIMVV